MSSSSRRDAAQPVDYVLAAAMQRLTGALSATTDVEGRLTAALDAACLPADPRPAASLDQFLDRGRRESNAALDATTDLDSHLTLTLTAYELDPGTAANDDTESRTA